MTEHEYRKVTLSQEQFVELQNNESFLALLTLARVVNSMKFCHSSLIKALEEKTPAGLRNRMASFLIACAVLWEGLRIAETIGKHFRDYATYRSGLQNLLRTINENRKLNTFLNHVRNQIAFHFDSNAIKGKLTDIGLKEYVFASGKGRASGEWYYELADDAFVHLLGKDDDGSNLTADGIEKLVQDATDLTIAFARTSEELIAEVCSNLGCEFEVDSNYA